MKMNRPQMLIVPLLVVTVLVLVASNVRAQPAGGMINREPEIRAGLIALQNNFWTWPARATPRPPCIIGILGNDPFQLAQELAGKSNIRAVNFPNVNAIAPCHILVISPKENLPQALAKIGKQPVLVIGQVPGMAQQGAVLNLPVVGNNVKMEINVVVAQGMGLTPSPDILRHATIIKQPPPPPPP